MSQKQTRFMNKETALVWFDKNLRTNDNQTLKAACDKHNSIIGLYCFDPYDYTETKYGFKKTGSYRAQFIIDSVNDLKKQLKKLNISLLTYCQNASDVITSLIKKYNITDVYFQYEWTDEERTLRQSIKNICLKNKIIWHQFKDQFLFSPIDVIELFSTHKPYDNIPKTFTQFRQICEGQLVINHSLPEIYPKNVENLIDTALDSPMPELKTLGLKSFITDQRSAFPFNGGTQTGKERLNDYFWKTNNLQEYKKNRNGLIGIHYSSKLSAWLAHGCLSAREIYWQVHMYEKTILKNDSTYWLIFELIWRDYFKYVSLQHDNKIFCKSGISNKSHYWLNDKQLMKNWIKGTTDEPFINANMKELLTTGWMSNRGRQNVASWWSKHKQQNWLIGASWFESQLIDYDVHSNWGNWMYLAGVGNDPRNRKFNIKKQAEQYDPNGNFQNLWLGKKS